MMPVINGAVLAISGSLAASIVVKATIVVALGLAASWLTRRNRAAVRHAVVAAAFGAALLLPIASIVAPEVHVAVPVLSPTTLPPVFSRVAPISPVAAAADGARGPALPRQSPAVSLSVLLLTGWIAGTVIFLAPVMTGLWRIRSLRRRGLPWTRGRSIVDTLALDAGIRRRVELLLHEALPGPITCGVLHPSIVLPLDAETWKGEDLNRALVHELEHVRRGDSVTRGLARAVCALYWFHPLIWTAWNKLVLEAERSCDDAVLRRSEATAYADQLLGLAKRLPAVQRSPLLAMANRSDLAKRVNSVLNSRQRRGRVGLLSVALTCGAATALVVAISPVILVDRARAQSPAELPTFEVASVRVNHSDVRRFSFNPRKDGFSAANVSLRMLVEYAYRVQDFQILGGPSWLSSTRFDVEARAQGTPTRDQTRLMLQHLLSDRFHLIVRKDTRELSVYDLVVAKGGLKVKEAKCVGTPSPTNPCGGFSGSTRGQLYGRSASMSEFAKTLTSILARTVRDKTGVTGSYDFDLTWTPDPSAEQGPGDPDAPPVDVNGPSIFTALQEQLGVRLESTKGAVAVLLIDSAERPSND